MGCNICNKLSKGHVVKTFYSPNVSDPLSETPCLVNQVYLMITHTKSSEYLYQMATGENRVGSKQSRE
jgi:hypothetical protein